MSRFSRLALSCCTRRISPQPNCSSGASRMLRSALISPSIFSMGEAEPSSSRAWSDACSQEASPDGWHASFSLASGAKEEGGVGAAGAPESLSPSARFTSAWS